jgi:hypothetical protein
VSESPRQGNRQLVERFQAVVSERYGASGAPTAELTISNVREATEQAYYLVAISNATDTSFIPPQGGVVVVYQTSDSPEQQDSIGELPAGGVVVFQLTSPGQCASLQSYVVGFVLEGEVAAIWPPDLETTGPWTPERISREYPQDQDPCVDSWILGR